MHKISGATPFDAILIIILGVSWGAAFASIKVSLEIVSPLHLVSIRVLLGAVFVFGYLSIKRLPLIILKENWKLAFGIAILSSIIPFSLINWAELSINSSLTSLIFSLGPLISIISNHLLTTDDKINFYKMIGIIVGFTGFIITVSTESLFTQTIKTETFFAILAVFLANTCYVISGIMVRKIKSQTPLSLGGNIFLMSILVTLPLLFFTPAKNITIDIGMHHIFAIVYLGLISTGASYILRIILILRVGQSYMSMAAYLIPPVGTLIGWLLLNEDISIYIVFSLILILLSMYLARKGQLQNTELQKIKYKNL